MGICGSSDSDVPSGWPKTVEPNPQFKWSYEVSTNKRKIKTSDKVLPYEARNLKGEVFSRAPGTINQQQIQIENCEDCDFYLCDTLDSLLVDDCKNCRFFVGPTSGSIFIRTSTQCKIVAACGQLRLRECKDLDFLLFCGSRPVVESSKRIKFSCFDGYYFGLKEQFDVVKLSVFNNRWSDIHDFTPSNQNYTLSATPLKMQDLIKPFSQIVPEIVSHEEESNSEFEVVVPSTWGYRELIPSGEYAVVIFLPGKSEMVLPLLKDTKSKHPDVVILQTKEYVIPLSYAASLFEKSDLLPEVKNIILTGPSIAIGFYGPSAEAKIRSDFSALSGVYVSKNQEESRYKLYSIL